MTNEEIADRLVLVNGTVANHVQAILMRLTLRNRTQIAAWAVERGLYQTAADLHRDTDSAAAETWSVEPEMPK